MPNLHLTAFDIAVVLVVGVSVLISLMRGAVREALTIASWVGAGVVCYYGYGYARELARQTIETGWLADAAAFAVVFVAPLVGFKIAAAMLSDHVPGGSIGLLDRIAGMAFGAARGAVIVCAAYLGLTMAITPEDQPLWVRQAIILPLVRDGADLLRRLMPQDFTLRVRQAADLARRSGPGLARTARELAVG